MIHQTDGIALIEFGTGDVLVLAGLIDDPHKTVGVVAFTSQDPRPIGRNEYEGDGCDIVFIEAEVQFEFPRTESIDVLIEMLQDCKKMMKQNTLCPKPLDTTGKD